MMAETTYRACDHGHVPGGPLEVPVRRILEAADREHGPEVPIVIWFDSDATMTDDPVIVGQDETGIPLAVLVGAREWEAKVPRGTPPPDQAPRGTDIG